jgi:hypothetical protein
MGRGARWLIIGLVTLLVVLIAADRIGVVVAEGIAADTLKSSQQLSSTPDVDIAGVPFLTQLATGHYDKITVTADDVPLGRGAHGLALTRLQVVLHDLDVSRSFSRFHAETADATATIGFGPLGDLLGVELSYAGDGRIEGTKSVSLAGQTLHARITATPQIVDGRLGFADTSVKGLQGLTGAVVDAILREFNLRIPLQGIPFQVELESLRVDASGVIITLTGQDLLYVKTGRAPS